MLHPEKRPSRFLKTVDKIVFRRQLQLREQPRILTAFLFTAKCGRKNCFLLSSKGIIDPKSNYVNRKGFSVYAKVTGARKENAGMFLKIP